MIVAHIDGQRSLGVVGGVDGNVLDTSGIFPHIFRVGLEFLNIRQFPVCVDCYCIDRLLDAGKKPVQFIGFFAAHQIHDIGGILVHHLIGIHDSGSSDDQGGKQDAA